MKNPFQKSQLRAIALEQAIIILAAERERVHNNLIGTDSLGNKIADTFDSSDEQQEEYNNTINAIMDEYDSVSKVLTQTLEKIGRFIH